MMENSKKLDTILFVLLIVALAAVNVYLFASGRLQPDAHGIGIMIAAGITVGMYSFLYKDNALFKAVEHIYVGVAAGYVLTIAWYNIFLPDVIRPLFLPEPGDERNFIKIVPLIMGILMVMRISARFGWVSRISFAFVMGFYSGISITNYLDTIVFKHIKFSILPLFTGAPLMDEINSLIVLIGVLSVLVYFWFSVEHKGPLKVVSSIGIYFLMVSFGASFGYTIMARLSLLVERLEFIMHDWLGIM